MIKPLEINDRNYFDIIGLFNKEDINSINLYKKVGFLDTGYIDEDLPDYLNLIYIWRIEKVVEFFI